VKAKKTVLIVTDGTEQAAKMADDIAAVLKKDAVTIKAACQFAGTDILPADMFFIGCENPKPASFEYLSELLTHINLAGRSCGVFSPGSEKAAAYLAGLLADSEAALYPRPLFAGDPDIAGWVEKIRAHEGRGKTGGRHGTDVQS
jgi:hypothetical protein